MTKDTEKPNIAIRSDGQGRGVLSFYHFLCLITICGPSFPLPTGDGGRCAVKIKNKLNLYHHSIYFS